MFVRMRTRWSRVGNLPARSTTTVLSLPDGNPMFAIAVSHSPRALRTSSAGILACSFDCCDSATLMLASVG